MKNKKSFLLFALFLGCLLLLLSACAGPNGLEGHPDQTGYIAGYWDGVWNGLTIMFSFIGYLFSDQISIYNVNNNGMGYNCGFMTPSIILFIIFMIRYIRALHDLDEYVRY